MYIKTNNAQHPCAWYASTDDSATFRGVTGLELPVEGTVTLCADDGFELAVQVAEDYARQTLVGDVLTLTNSPEPEPMPDPPEPQLDDITALQLAIAELAETQTADQTANELALAELAEIVLGG